MTTISAEQMPGGRAQISARTLAGEQQFLSPQLPNYKDAIEMLEQFRLFCGGELDENPAATWVAARAEEQRLLDEADRAHEEALRKSRQDAADQIAPVWSPPGQLEAVPA